MNTDQRGKTDPAKADPLVALTFLPAYRGQDRDLFGMTPRGAKATAKIGRG